MTALQVMKGHGTENDFVLIADLDGTLDLTPSLVRSLCDRHGGIGADGVLRVVRSASDATGEAMAAEAEFFMDYRNADGSLAEMCGNGVRVFLRYLQELGLVGAKANIATRGGVRRAWLEDDGQITVEMGTALLLTDAPTVTPYGSSVAYTGTALELPNPHVVVVVASTGALAELDLTRSPTVEPALPNGQNVEFVVRAGPQHLVMRVHERGVGETRSCGTGICAAVVAVAGAAHAQAEVGDRSDNMSWQVDVPGGSCLVRWEAGGELLLTGPAVLVGTVELNDQWLMTVGGSALAAI